MTVATSLQQPTKRQVCVWFGAHKIVDHLAEPAYAARFEAAMRRRFASLRITNEPAPVTTTSTGAAVPDVGDQ